MRLLCCVVVLVAMATPQGSSALFWTVDPSFRSLSVKDLYGSFWIVGVSRLIFGDYFGDLSGFWRIFQDHLDFWWVLKGYFGIFWSSVANLMDFSGSFRLKCRLIGIFQEFLLKRWFWGIVWDFSGLFGLLWDFLRDFQDHLLHFYRFSWIFQDSPGYFQRWRRFSRIFQDFSGFFLTLAASMTNSMGFFFQDSAPPPSFEIETPLPGSLIFDDVWGILDGFFCWIPSLRQDRKEFEEFTGRSFFHFSWISSSFWAVLGDVISVLCVGGFISGAFAFPVAFCYF